MLTSYILDWPSQVSIADGAIFPIAFNDDYDVFLFMNYLPHQSASSLKAYSSHFIFLTRTQYSILCRADAPEIVLNQPIYLKYQTASVGS